MRIFGLLAVAVALIACNNTGKLGSAKLETRLDSMSYALGQDLGGSLKEQEIEVNADAVYAGLDADAEGATPLLTEEQKQAILASWQAEMQQKAMQQMQEEMQRQQQQPPADSQPFQKQSNVQSGSIGKPAPEIALATPAGDILKLSSLRGQVVLIDFWASWCKPCRMENPNVVRMYNKYHSKGFEIYGVSLDRDKNAWVKAIEADKLTWKHVSDLKFWQSEAAATYGVNAIPYTVLIDAEGNIIGERLRGASLEKKLAEIFGE